MKTVGQIFRRRIAPHKKFIIQLNLKNLKPPKVIDSFLQLFFHINEEIQILIFLYGCDARLFY